MKEKRWGLVKYSNFWMNTERQFLMEEFFLVKLGVKPVFSSIFIYCLATELDPIDFY